MYMGQKHLKKMAFKEKEIDNIRYEFVKNTNDKSIVFAVASTVLSLDETEYVVHEIVDGYPVLVIEDFCFSSAFEAIRVTLPPTIIKIGRYAFKGCEMLRQVNFPQGIEVIEHDAFAGCVELNDINLSNVKTIEHDAFAGCSALQTIDLSNVEVIECNAFLNCTSLTSIKINDKASILGGAFKNTPLERKYNMG